MLNIRRCARRFWIVVSMLLLTGGAVALSQAVRLDELRPATDGIPGEESWRKTIDVGPGVKLDAAMDVTVRRNGTLRVGNLELHALDEYDNGLVFVGGLLHSEFKDISGDGFKDLVLTGTAKHTGEKENDPVSYEPITSIYLFRAKEKDFELVFHVGPRIDRNEK